MPPGVEVRELRRAEVVVLVAGTGAAERIGSGRRREGREMDLDGGERMGWVQMNLDGGDRMGDIYYVLVLYTYVGPNV